MVEFTLKPDGTLLPALQPDDIRINLLEVATISISDGDGKRTVSGEYHDGSSFKVTIDRINETFTANLKGGLTEVSDSTDKSSCVLTLLPKTRLVSKRTH